MAEQETGGTGTPPTEVPSTETPPNGVPPADRVIDGAPDTPPGPWYPDAYKDNAAITRYNDLDAFVKASLEREKLVGEKQGIQYPGADASKEDWQAFWKQTPGFTETLEGYTVEPPSIPVDAPGALTEDEFNQFRRDMHEAGMPPQLAEAAIKWYERQECMRWEQANSEAQEIVDRGMGRLKEKFGAQLDYYLAVAREGLKQEFGDDLSWLDMLVTKDSEGREQLLHQTPEFIEMAVQWSLAKGHDAYVAGGLSGPESVNRAKEQFDQLYIDLKAKKITNEQFSKEQARLAPIIFGRTNAEMLEGGMTVTDIPPR